MTSLSRLLGRDVTVAEVRPVLERHLADVFDLAFTAPPEDVARLFSPAADAA